MDVDWTAGEGARGGRAFTGLRRSPGEGAGGHRESLAVLANRKTRDEEGINSIAANIR